MRRLLRRQVKRAEVVIIQPDDTAIFTVTGRATADDLAHIRQLASAHLSCRVLILADVQLTAVERGAR